MTTDFRTGTCGAGGCRPGKGDWMSSLAPALEVQALRGGWGPTTVVDGVDLVLGAGEVVAVIGRNGVGKSTLLETIVGRARRHAGAIRISGVEAADLAIHLRARLGLGYVPQEREVFKSLTVRENLAVAQRPGAWDTTAAFDLFPSLAKRQHNHAGQLSGGEQQMLAIARALVGNPRVLLMDEPSEGLAPVIVDQLVAALSAIARDGSMAFLLVEQRIDVALELSSRCLVMDRGRFVHEGDSAVLRRNPEGVGDLLGLQQAA
jgi:branched-chain amino acid transport system ATP-binding protein